MEYNEISFLIIALAFVILVAFIIKFLLDTTKTLKKADETLEKVNFISDDLSIKMQSIQPVFNIVEQVGEGVEYRATAFKKAMAVDCLKEQLKEQPSNEEDIYLDLVDCALLGVSIWRKLKAK